ncbi:ankyrin repeat domain-containing protein 50-like [Saccostrea cucullata]|uniref:ankyrin repeat domain-containing protein 50-like n=1 Tax=Saccostrea cuccullata TaxID=36930 RepID=UPI002ED4B1B3
MACTSPLTDSFIIKDGDAYKLLHAKLTEIIACHFAKESLQLLIKFAPMWILDARLRNPSRMSIQDIDESEYFILLNSLCKPVLAERILNRLESESIYSNQEDYMEQTEDVYDLLFNLCFPDDQIDLLLFDGLKSNGKLNFILHQRSSIGNPRIVNYIEYKKKSREQESEKEELKKLGIPTQNNWTPLIPPFKIIAFYSGDMRYFYKRLSAEQLLEINENNFLFWLVGAGWTHFLERSLEVADTDLKDELFKCKNTAFLLSLLSGNLHMNEALVNLKDKNGNTPLVVSCENGNTIVVQMLVENGADLEEKCCLDMFESDFILDTFEDELEEEGWSALWWACYGGHLTIVSYLLDKGANFQNTNKSGKTPLWAAIQSKNYEMVALLMEKGLNVNDQDKNGRTPIWWASNSGMTLLIENGANVNMKLNKGQTVLIHCIWNTDDVAHKLRYRLHDISAKDDICFNFYPDTSENFPELLSLLIEYGADLNCQDDNGLTALMGAVLYKRDRDRTKILLENGAYVNLQNKDSQSALHYACFKQNHEAVSLLIEYGASINAKDVHGLTPSHIACELLDEETLDLLLNNGADINVIDNMGFTPLLRLLYLEVSVKISKKGNDFNENEEEKRRSDCVVAIALKLLDHGVDPMACAFGYNALFLAMALGYRKLSEVLLEFDEMDDSGKTSMNDKT